MSCKKKRQQGFTLVEIVLVIVIIGILTAIIIPKFAGQTDSAKIAKTKANLASLRSAVRLFQSDNQGTAPAALGDLIPNYIRAIPEEGVTPSTNVSGAVDGSGGWAYDAATGETSVNLAGNDTEGNAYSGY